MKDFFVPPGHFYSPWPDPDEALWHLKETAARNANVRAVALDLEAIKNAWHLMLPAMQKVPFPETQRPAFRYYFQNDFYSYGDASIYFSMISWHRPRTIIEIGSGFSTALALDTLDYLQLSTELICVEPYPDTLLSLLREEDHRRVEIIRKKVQHVPLSKFETLAEGDILFIDSSHVAKTGSDVCFEVFELLPMLRPGVLVHFHDVFYPFEYPAHWVVNEKRAWNEIYVLRAFLMYNIQFRVVFFNDFFQRMWPELVAVSGTLFGRNPGGSLWLSRD